MDIMDKIEKYIGKGDIEKISEGVVKSFAKKQVLKAMDKDLFYQQLPQAMSMALDKKGLDDDEGRKILSKYEREVLKHDFIEMSDEKAKKIAHKILTDYGDELEKLKKQRK